MFKTRLIHAVIIIMIMLFSIGVSHATSKYTIIYESAKVRNDRGKNYYVLLEPVNLQNSDFRKDIEQIVKEIALKKGRNITIDFFDDQKLLESYYQLQRKSVIKVESRTEVFHHIARFTARKGNRPVLMFLPGLSTTNAFGSGKEILQYEFIIFDPYK